MKTETLTLRKAASEEANQVSRVDSYVIDPRKIIVEHRENVRVDYGDEEGEMAELKASIKEHGVKLPVIVVATNEGFKLSHGFRRMKAVMELIAEGVPIERVPVKQRTNNSEEILIDHFVLNTGKKMSDLEVGDCLNRLSVLMGRDDFKEISKRTGVDYQKAVRLINFIRQAGTQIKASVAEKKMAISTAQSLIAGTASVSEQNTILAKAEKKSKGGKIKSDIVAKTKKEPVQNRYKTLTSIIANAPECTFKKKLTTLIEAIESGKSENVIVKTCF